jgi:hypothetical protein
MNPIGQQGEPSPELLAEIRQDAEWRAWVKHTLEHLSEALQSIKSANEGEAGLVARLARAEAANERTAEKLRWVVAILAAVTLAVGTQLLAWVLGKA